jgi:hypothetical protein
MEKRRAIGLFFIYIGLFLFLSSASSNMNITGMAISENTFKLTSIWFYSFSFVFVLVGILLAVSGEYGGLVDALRNSKQGVPKGEFQAARYIAARGLDPEGGYHIHVSYLDGGQYKDSKYFITIKDGQFVAVAHNEGARGAKPPVDLGTKNAKKQLFVDLYEEFKKLKKRHQYREVPSKDREGVIVLGSVDEIR